jgi:hypothetical protein
MKTLKEKDGSALLRFGKRCLNANPRGRSVAPRHRSRQDDAEVAP